MNPSKIVYKFDVFSLLPGEKILLRGNDSIPLSNRTFEVLYLLVQKEGKIVLKQEFLEKVWANTYVEEGNLPVAINSLRKILTTNENKTYIETFPKRGYRFNAQVEKVLIEDSANMVLKQPNSLASSNFLSNINSSSDIQPKSFGKDSPLLAILSKMSGRWLLSLLILGIFLYGFTTFALPDKTRVYAATQANTQDSKVRIAVLPFVDLKPGIDTQKLCLGFADSIMYELSQNSAFSVVSSIPIDKYFQKIPNPDEIKKETEADFIVSSTFHKNGDIIEMSSQLIEVKSGTVVFETKEHLNNENLTNLKKEYTTKLASIIKLYSNQLYAALNKKM